MSWQIATFAGLALVVFGGFAWYERARPPARVVALVAALAALAVAGRLVLAPVPNLVATTDIALITGYALGGPAGFAVGALAAPISNIWLGQGPWTAWQMAGWGLVGLAGAWLAAVTGRRAGRWGLAIACGLAGLAYGALLDLSVMVSYGGEQSLDRYLALSARGAPFNVVHAVGNFAIALAAGPALVRMISRYRARLEFSWRPARALPLVLAAAVVAASALAPAPARAASPTAQARAWLVGSQNPDGGFAAARDQPSSPAMTGWVMLGLEAAGRNPLDVREGGETPVSYLREQAGRLRSPGDLERTILALEAAGIDPRGFGGTDLVAALRDRRDRDGSVDGQVNLTAFFILALRSAGAEPGDLGRPAAWLRRAQNRDGGWGFRANAPSDPDSTGAALQALAAAASGGDAREDGVRWLRRAQRGDGGFALATSGVVNSQSTAWAVQGLVAAGAGGKPLDRALAHLAGLRAGDGHYRYSRASDQTPVWVTAQALIAVERRAFPLPVVARRPSGGEDENGSDPAGRPPAATGSTGAPSAGADDSSGSGLTGPIVSGQGDQTAEGAQSPAAGGGEADAHGEGRGGNDGARGADAAEAEAEAGDLPAAAPPMAADAEAEPVAATEEDEPLAPYVAGGLGLLAVVLAAGFLWYRRRLP